MSEFLTGLKQLSVKATLLAVCAMMGFRSQAQSLTPQQYIALYKDYAISEMKRMGVPAAITLAQGLLETESGNSVLVKKSNNHFGIKCKNNWTAGGVSHDDDAPGECFRVYKTAEESYRDHSNFLRGGGRYAFLFQLDPSDYKAWAHGLKKAGYATNPKYPAILIRSIEQYGLQQYTIAGLQEVPDYDSKEFKDDPISFEQEQTTAPEPVMATTVAQVEQFTTTPEGADRTTRVNGNKCILAVKGTSLLALASRHRINLKKLLDYNDLEEDGILEADQLIFLQRKSTRGEEPVYTVQQTETYYDIAQKKGIQLQSILEYNQVEEDRDLPPGTQVFLQAGAGNSLAVNSSRSQASNAVYEVKAGEGLYGIARKHNLTVQQLREWNNLTSDDLKVGQQLVVGK